MADGKQYDAVLKLLIIGDSGVGKSSLLLQYAESQFSETYINTIGVDFKLKTVKIGDKVVKMQIWDTAGQERYRTITSTYYRGTQGIMLVYDITNKSTFDSIKRWLTEIEENAGTEVSKILVGNKVDLVGKFGRGVETSEAKNFADSLNVAFFECSARENLNVSESFETLAKDSLKHLKTEDKDVVKPQSKPGNVEKKEKCNC